MLMFIVMNTTTATNKISLLKLYSDFTNLALLYSIQTDYLRMKIVQIMIIISAKYWKVINPINSWNIAGLE
jgi:hypothetical protein